MKQKYGYAARGIDIATDSPHARQTLVDECDVIIFSVPIAATPGVILEYVHHAQRCIIDLPVHHASSGVSSPCVDTLVGSVCAVHPNRGCQMFVGSVFVVRSSRVCQYELGTRVWTSCGQQLCAGSRSTSL